jgi:hypothetical protein
MGEFQTVRVFPLRLRSDCMETSILFWCGCFGFKPLYLHLQKILFRFVADLIYKIENDTYHFYTEKQPNQLADSGQIHRNGIGNNRFSSQGNFNGCDRNGKGRPY